MKGYTNIKEIENYSLTEIDLGFYDQIEEWIEFAEQYIEKNTGRVFIADKEYSTRIFDGSNSRSLIIDNCIDIEWVKVNGKSVEVHKYPANSKPYNSLVTKSGYFFYGGLQNVEISAKWGYSENVPADIKRVATVIVSGIIQKSSNKKDMASISLGAYSASFTDDQMKDVEKIDNILDRYKLYL